MGELSAKPPAAIVFDLYGTLLAIDAMRGHAERVGIGDAPSFVDAWRRKQLEYTFLVTIAGAYEDFDALTARALDHVCTARRVVLHAAMRRALCEAWTTMAAYPDVAPALRVLSGRRIPLAVLTNGTPRSADRALEEAGVRELLDEVLSVEAVRAFKPDPRAYALATQRFGCVPGDVLFVSSNPFDVWGGGRFGFQVAWCNRSGGVAETVDPPPAFTIAGLDELPALVADGRQEGTLR